ncbi:hypothetical protein SK128_020021 [Halocaridina rubra]|uniref:SHSP domain-containing protein n=1 Tax=Halocaridina rubra TaxID=373956 RepID=A0AAN8WNM3_HALRR
MAPIHKERSTSMYSSSAARPVSCSCRDALDDWEWSLPITRRGHFFQDSFFENARSNFDDAIRDILGKWDATSMLNDVFQDRTNNFRRYRQLRNREMKEENQAVNVTSDNTSHKIVLDVHDFSEGDVKVKVIGEREVLVEGQIENKKEEASSVSMGKFSRRFLLPDDVDVDAISSVMSQDGILTIVAPKKKNLHSQEKARIILHKEATSNSASQASKSTAKSTQESFYQTSKCNETQSETESEKYCENCYKKLQSTNKKAQDAVQEKIQIPVQNYTTKQNNTTAQTDLRTKEVTESMEKADAQTCQAGAASSSYNCKVSEEAATVQDTNHSLGSQNTSRNIPISVNFSTLPITRRGLFFNDSIFENSRGDFLSAVQDVLSKWGERSSFMDDLTSYRHLRSRDLREENQAMKMSEDESSHKFVLDVHDFMNGGEVNVKAINAREIVVEGHIEKQEGGAKSVKRFFKRFAVPGDIILEDVSSVMSTDGVLTITAPKKPPTIQIRDVTSPIRTEKSQESSGERQSESNVKRQNEKQSSEVHFAKSKEEKCELNSSRHTTSAAASDAHAYQETQKCMNNEHIIPVRLESLAKDVKINNQYTSDNSQEELIKKTSKSPVSQQTSNVSKSENHTEQNRREIKIKQIDAASSTDCETKNEALETNSSGRYLPITRRGSFLTDSFFHDSRQSFQQAVKDVLIKFNEKSYPDDLTAYRGLRQRNLTFENQACNVHEDECCHKVVIDARDFINGDISVSVIGEKELVIEGKNENKKDAASSSLSFCRRFLLPDSVDIQSITSAISSDGVLTVESPKRKGSSICNNVQKMSSEAHAKQESHSDSGHSWEEQSVKESSEQSEGFSSRCINKSYRSHQEQSFKNTF